MRPFSRFVLLAVCLVAASCGGSHPKTYGEKEVRDVLLAHGFKVEMECGSAGRPFESKSCFGNQGGTVVGLLELFSGGNLKVKGVESVVVEQSSRELGVTAWILDSEARADSWQKNWSRPNDYVVRLQKRNVVVVVPKTKERPARAAVEDLN